MKWSLEMLASIHLAEDQYVLHCSLCYLPYTLYTYTAWKNYNAVLLMSTMSCRCTGPSPLSNNTGCMCTHHFPAPVIKALWP